MYLVKSEETKNIINTIHRILKLSYNSKIR